MPGAGRREDWGEDGEEGCGFQSEDNDVVWEGEGCVAVEEMVGSGEGVAATQEGNADKI